MDEQVPAKKRKRSKKSIEKFKATMAAKKAAEATEQHFPLALIPDREKPKQSNKGHVKINSHDQQLDLAIAFIKTVQHILGMK